MLVIDQVRRSDPRLRFLGAMILFGFTVLLAGFVVRANRLAT